MAAATITAPPDMTSDATFRTWGSAISAQLAAMGLTQSSGVGTQINWTTVTKPGAGNTVAGYEVWQFGDTLQGTTPVFFKIEYGTGSSGATFPGVWITVGFAVNSSGTVTSTNATTRAAVNVTPSVTGFSSFFSGSTNRIAFCLWGNHTTAASTLLFLLERTKDSSGADTSTGVYVGTCVGGATPVWQYLPASGAVPSSESRFVVALTMNSTSTFGTLVGTSPVFPVAGSLQSPGLNLLATIVNDYPTPPTQVTISVFGSNHNYIAVTANLGTAGFGSAGAGLTARPLMIYE